MYDSISDFDVFRGYKDELALEGASAGSSRVMDVLGGIQFHGAEKWAPGETPDHLNYSVRVDPLRIPPTTATRKKVSRRWGEDGWYLYYFSGFTLLQVRRMPSSIGMHCTYATTPGPAPPAGCSCPLLASRPRSPQDTSSPHSARLAGFRGPRVHGP